VWSGAGERERKNCTFRLGAEREHSIEGKWWKEAKLQREWVCGLFSRENDSDTHAHTLTGTPFQILFYSMSACLVFSTKKPLIPNSFYY